MRPSAAPLPLDKYSMLPLQDYLARLPSYGPPVPSAPPWSDEPYFPEGFSFERLHEQEAAIHKEEPVAAAGTRWPTLPGITVTYLDTGPYILAPLPQPQPTSRVARHPPSSHKRPTGSPGLWALTAAAFVAAVAVTAAEPHLSPRDQATVTELGTNLGVVAGFVAILRPWRAR
jgi:hypothetical protein